MTLTEQLKAVQTLRGQLRETPVSLSPLPHFQAPVYVIHKRRGRGDNAINGTSLSRDGLRPLLARGPSPSGRGRNYALCGLQFTDCCRPKTQRQRGPEDV